MQFKIDRDVVKFNVGAALLAVFLGVSGCGGSGGQGQPDSGVAVGLSPGPIERASVSYQDTEGDRQSQKPAISADGRYVAFESDAVNLVLLDTNASRDIFLRDTELDTTQRVSVASGSVQANGSSYTVSINSDGGYLAFESLATNLVTGDNNAARDIFWHDNAGNTTVRVSVSSTNGQSNGASFNAAISPEGRFVAFESDANNLLATADSNAARDVFLHDTQTGETVRVSINSSEQQAINGESAAAAVSSDGRYVAFQSKATNLVAGDSNAVFDVFRRDTVAGETIRISVTSLGAQANFQSVNPGISADGRYVVFESDASNLVAGDTNAARDIFVRDTLLNTTERVSLSDSELQANTGSSVAVISDDGRYVAFQSAATNLVAGGTNGLTNVFVRDRVAGTTVLFSTNNAGTQANRASQFAALSGSGTRIAFDSDASNLVSGDLNGVTDVFVRNRTN